MIEDNQGQKSQNNNNVNSSLGKAEEDQQNSDTVTVQGTTFTREEIEAANKPQPNVILDKISGGDSKLNRDTERVNPRANEAADSTDTNTGGIISGGAKGASQS